MVSFSLVHIDINMYFQLFWGAGANVFIIYWTPKTNMPNAKSPILQNIQWGPNSYVKTEKCIFVQVEIFFTGKIHIFSNWNYTKVSVFSESYASKAWQTSFQMNRVFATNPNFRIPISLQHNVVNFWYFKLKLFE